MGNRILNDRTRLKRLLILAALFVACSPGFICNAQETKPDVEIKSIKSLGTGAEKVRIPGVSRTVYVLGSSAERVFTVKIRNNTKEEKRDVRVKLYLYDKKGKSIGESSPSRLKALYADDGYLIGDGILYPRKSVKLYFVVDKRTKYVKAKVFCEDKLIDTKSTLKKSNK